MTELTQKEKERLDYLTEKHCRKVEHNRSREMQEKLNPINAEELGGKYAEPMEDKEFLEFLEVLEDNE